MTNLLDDLLPDFDDMNNAATTSAEARLQAHLIKEELDEYIADCVRKAYQNQEFWVNGKPPTQVYIERVVSVVGNTAEDAERIKTLTQRYLELQQVVDASRSLLLTMRDQLAAFQTLSSNKRAGVT